MKEIAFRFKIIKSLGKIKFSIPLKIRLKISLYILKIAKLFIKFEPIKKMEIPKLIIQDKSGYYNGDEWIETSE